MHFNRFFTAKANFKVCIEAQNFRSPFFPCQSLLLSTNVLNDKWKGDFTATEYFTSRICTC